MIPEFAQPSLCFVTDRKRCNGRQLQEVVSMAVEGGVDMVQVREKDLSANELLELSLEIREITYGKAMLFINDRVDVALACRADGVQLGEQGLPLRLTRELVKGKLIIGKSVHSKKTAIASYVQKADMLVAGTVFYTKSHTDTDPSGVGLLSEIISEVPIPILGIGGINAQNVVSVIKSGAFGVAVITAISESSDPSLASTDLISKMKRAWNDDSKISKLRIDHD